MRKKIFNFFVSLFLMTNIFGLLPLQAESNRIIWVGDSRFVGMKQSVSSGNDVYVAEGGMGYTWFINTAIPQVNSNLKDGDVIVVNLGVNGFGASSYISTVNRLSNSDWKNHKIYYMSINPVIDSLASQYGMTVRNSQVEDFNEQLKNGLDSSISYIDTYSTISQDLSARTSDGVHYNATTYKEIYDIAQKSVTGLSVREQNEKGEDCDYESSSSGAIVPTKFEDIEWDGKWYQYNEDGVHGSPNVCEAGASQWPGNYGSCGPGYPSSTGGVNKMICESYASSRYWDVHYHNEDYPFNRKPQYGAASILFGSETQYNEQIPIVKSVSELESGSFFIVDHSRYRHALFLEEIRPDGSVVITESNWGSGTGNEFGWQVTTYSSINDFLRQRSYTFIAAYIPPRK